ncbi:MAG TPA: hypothetical protein VMN60_02405 [Longimicrobiales bacterium]|nr:hypothetical protein [Longimicrobiales bacterium]
MSRKKQHRGRREKQRGEARRKSRLTASKLFIGLIVLIIAIAALATVFANQPVDCPPGQVWSDDHNHCH